MALRQVRAAAALAVAALLPACWVPADKGRQMESRIARLEGENEVRVKELDEQRALVRDRMAQVDAKMAEVQKKLDELNATAHRTGADLAVSQDQLKDEFTRLKGTLEEQQHKLEAIDQSLAQTRSDVDGRFAALRGAGALDEWEAKKKLETLKRPTDKAQFLALAQDQEAKGEKAVARELYEEFVKKWPSDPRAADAHFRLGELWYGEKRWRDAVLEYGKVAQDFPRSDKAPDALLRTGESMLALDLPDEARKLFEGVVQRYPKTSAAQRAKARLAELSPPKKKNGAKR